MHRWLCLLFKCFISQPAQYQGFTAHRRYFYRCFLPDLTEFKICLLRKAENINTAYATAHFQQNSPTGIQSCIKRVSGYREPLTPHLAQIKVFKRIRDENLHNNRVKRREITVHLLQIIQWNKYYQECRWFHHVHVLTHQQ